MLRSWLFLPSSSSHGMIVSTHDIGVYVNLSEAGSPLLALAVKSIRRQRHPGTLGATVPGWEQPH